MAAPAAPAPGGIDANLYSRQIGVFGMETCVRARVWGMRAASRHARARHTRPLPRRAPPPARSMGKLVKLDVLIVGMRGLGVEIGA